MAASEPIPGEARIEGEVRRARTLLEKREFAAALAAAQSLLAEVPENRDVFYLAAVSQRYLGRIADALQTLARFEEVHPDFGRLFQERGHCYRAAGEAGAAIEAYRRAVTLNGALTASWKALAELFRAADQSTEAAYAAEQAARLERLPMPVVSASGMLNEGDIHGAERLLRRFLQTHGDHVEAMRLLAQIGIKLEILDDAEFLLESALAFAPDHVEARYDYAVVLSQRHKHALALDEAEKLLRIEPANRAFRIIYANACVGLGKQEAALGIFRDLLDGSAQKAELYLSIGHAEKTLGRQPAAVEAYRSAATAQPSFGDAYWSLANLKTYRFTDKEITRMRAQEAAPTTALVDRYHLCFALGKALEDRSEYEESFRYYERGNALKKSESKHSRERARAHDAPAGPGVHGRILRRPARKRDATAPRRYSSSVCRGPAPPFSSRSSRRTRKSKARRSSRRFRNWCNCSPAASKRTRSRVIRACSRSSNRISCGHSARNTSPTPGSTGRASRISSTRCRTISGTSA